MSQFWFFSVDFGLHEKNPGKYFVLDFCNAESSSHHYHHNINVVANAGTICHWPKCAVFMWHQCERRLNENVTTRTETKQKKNNENFQKWEKKVRKKLNALGMVDGGRVRQRKWTFNVGFDNFCASSFCSSHY